MLGCCSKIAGVDGRDRPIDPLTNNHPSRERASRGYPAMYRLRQDKARGSVPLLRSKSPNGMQRVRENLSAVRSLPRDQSGRCFSSLKAAFQRTIFLLPFMLHAGQARRDEETQRQEKRRTARALCERRGLSPQSPRANSKKRCHARRKGQNSRVQSLRKGTGEIQSVSGA